MASRLGRVLTRIVLVPIIGLLLIPTGLLSPQPAAAYKICPEGYCNHEDMAVAARSVYNDDEILTYWHDIQDGVTDEDLSDHVYGLDINIPGVGQPYVTATHFWDADKGLDDPVGNLLGSFPNAWQETKALWMLALGEYANGNKTWAYHYLGHVAHFIGDNSLPAHVHEDTHGPVPVIDDAYEEWMRENAGVSGDELTTLMDLGPLNPGETADPLFWLLYTTNQIADFFASDATDGDAVDPLRLIQTELDAMARDLPNAPRLDHNLDDNDGDLIGGDSNNNDGDGDLSMIRRYSYLRGIRATAGLFKLFGQTVRQQVTLSVVIERVEEDEKHDATCPLPGCEPDFFARVAIGNRESQNRGNHIDGTEDIDPGWIFGNTVPTSGSVPVRVEIFDHDGKYEDLDATLTGIDDEQSDVDGDNHEGDRSLELSVDLAKCIARQPGAISGDLSGACDSTLSQAGDAHEDASLVYFRILVSKSPPTADAGGPYATSEGTDVTLDATGSADPDNDVTTYAWDFDGDGSCDDANGSKPSFTAVGQDRVTTVKLCVTDAAGLTDEDTATVAVSNVAPSIDLTSNSPTGENTTVTVSGTISDPGWLDSLSGSISWGDGSEAETLSGTIENTRPDATLTFSASHTYGDNGTFTAQVCAADDDTTPCTTTLLQITNTAPTAVIDLSGAVSVNGTPTVIAHAGQAVTFNGRSTDPGSDDLTLTWTWGDGTAASSTTSLVNPPNTDPVLSPSIQPRDVPSPASHAFAGACAYETTFAARDDDTGAASQTAAVIIVGNGSPNQAAGYWKQQFRYYNSGKNNADFDAATLRCYLKIASYMSRVFDERNDSSTFLRAEDILETNQTSAILELFDQQLLAAWLNFANGAVEWNRLVDTNGDKRADTRFLDAITAAESLRLDANASRVLLDRQKVILETWTRLP